MTKIPKKIWMFWLQGWDNATELSKLCLDSWTRLNPAWDVIALDRNNISDYLELDTIVDDFDARKPISCTVDILNMNLLKRYGGLWIDSTVLCLKPLDDWLNDVTANGFFSFKFDPIVYDEEHDQHRLLSTWFLAASPSNYLIETWCESYNDYWQERLVPDRYFDFHYLFHDIYKQDSKFRQIFDNVPYKDAYLMHSFNPYVTEEIPPPALARVLAGDFEMAKVQNVYPDKTYEGEEIIKNILASKHENHMQKSSDIVGFRQLHELVTTHYQNTSES